jgi:SAM-dependent methyltransferase
MTKWDFRTDAEWCEVMNGMRSGHIPSDDPVCKKKGYELAYIESVEMRQWFPVLPSKKDIVLDLGCGNGRFAVACLPTECMFVGLDPIKDSVDFCTEAFKPWDDRYSFRKIDVRNEAYNPGGAIDPMEFVLPYKSGFFDYAAAISLFTHLQTVEIAEHYLDEMFRVVRPGGVIATTWFRSPPNAVTSNVNRTVYRESKIIQMLIERGGKWIDSGCGPAMHAGCTTSTHDQWRIWVRR